MPREFENPEEAAGAPSAHTAAVRVMPAAPVTEPAAGNAADLLETPAVPAAVPAAEPADGVSPAEPFPMPDDETLLALCEPLKGQYPRMDTEHMIGTDAFRAFGDRVGWDTRALQAGLPGLLADAAALMQAAQPPVSRVTGTAAQHRRPLLSPHQQRELADWNRANPQYRMTELEYFQGLKNG